MKGTAKAINKTAKLEIIMTVMKNLIFSARNFKSGTSCVPPNLVEDVGTGKQYTG